MAQIKLKKPRVATEAESRTSLAKKFCRLRRLRLYYYILLSIRVKLIVELTTKPKQKLDKDKLAKSASRLKKLNL